MNSKSKGEVSEAVILARLLKIGWSVSLPFGNNQRYDMIVDNGSSLLKSQCKTGRKVNGCVSFSVASKNGFTGVRKPYQGEVDIFLVYCPAQESVYLIPIDIITNINSVQLRVDPLKSTAPTSTIKWAKDYLI